MAESINPIMTDNTNTININATKPQQLNIKLKTDKKNNKLELEPTKSVLEQPHQESGSGSSKRTQKAKTSKNNIKSYGEQIELPNTIDEIIGDMVFQEPNGTKAATTNILKDTLAQQQEQVLKKQKELLDQLQQGIRPGWFIQCVGRRADGKQCTRNIKKGSEFCMGHTIKAAYGRITPSIASASSNISGGVDVVMKPKTASKSKRSLVSNISNVEDVLDISSESEDENSTTIPDDIKKLIAENNLHSNTISTRQSSSQTTTNKKLGKATKQASKSNSGILSITDENGLNTIEEDTSQSTNDTTKQPKKRGRRRKLPIDARFGNNDYIIMWPIICEDQRFLTDRYENIYSNNPEHPTFIGIREVGGTINRTALPNSS